MEWRSRKTTFSLSLLFILTGAVSCATTPSPYRTHPDYNSRIKAVKKTVYPPPDVKVYELSAGGVHELRDDWCDMGRENLQREFEEVLDREKFNVKKVTVDEDIRDEMEDIQALYRAVSASILDHTYGSQRFPEKEKKFIYSVGPVEYILEKFNADALLFVYGIDEISTGGRKALTALGIIAGAFTGVYVAPRYGITAVSVALIDRTGEILWYSVKGSQGGYDLREPESCHRFVKDIASNFSLVELPKVKMDEGVKYEELYGSETPAHEGQWLPPSHQPLEKD